MLAATEAFRKSLIGRDTAEVIEIAVSLFVEKEELNIQLTEFRNASTEMSTQYQLMKDQLNAALRENEELRKQNMHLTGVNTIRTNDLFGRSTEKTDDILDAVANATVPADDPLSEDAPETEAIRENRERIRLLASSFDRLASEKKPRSKRMDLSRLPVQTCYEFDCDVLDSEYGKGNWRIAHWDEVKTVEVIRQSTYLKVTYRPVVSVGVEHVLARPPHSEALIPKSVASPSLLSLIMNDRNRMFLPLNRQQSDSERFGFPLSKQTMSNWIKRVTTDHLEPVYEYLCAKLKTYPYQQCDETYYTVVMNEKESGKNFVWVHRSGELVQDPAIVIYCYDKSRSADHLRDFYEGISGVIRLTCDAYSAYPSFATGADGLVELTGCAMHCRRRFVEALLLLHAGNWKSEEFFALPEAMAVLLMRDIYAADTPLKKLSTEERFLARQETVKPKVDAFFEFVHSLDLSDPAFSEKLKDAVKYALNQEPLLRKFLDDGNISIDNGATERSIRSVSLYRRNSLFSFTPSGARSNMIIFSLIETAKANGADPYWYLKYLLENMPNYLYAKNSDHLPDMTPWSEAYRRYEKEEKLNSIRAQAPPGNEKPSTPVKGKRKPESA